MGVESCESKVVKEVPELGPVLWPYRGRYLTKKSPLAQLSRYRLCRLNIFTCQQNLEPFWRLGRKSKAALRATYYSLGLASLLTTVDSVRHDFSSSLQMQRDKKMLQLASSLGFMYWILFFASFTDTNTLMAWNIRHGKNAAFCLNVSVPLAYLPVKGQHANVSGWEHRIFSVCCMSCHSMICFAQTLTTSCLTSWVRPPNRNESHLYMARGLWTVVLQFLRLQRHPGTTMQSLVTLMPLRQSDSQEWCTS